MNPVALYFASGESLYVGAALLVLVMVTSPLLKRTRLLRNVIVWLAVAMMVMASPPFPVVIDLIFLAAFLLWFVVWNRAVATPAWLRLRYGSTVLLIAFLLALTALELSHRSMPVITGKPSDHLVVIGDSISSGIDPGIPAWPLILEQTSRVSVRNLARPGAQVSEALTMAEKLTPDDRVVLIEIGGNDLLMGVPPGAFALALDALLSKISTPGRTVVMFELPLWPYKIAYGQIQRRLSAKYGVSLIPKRYFTRVIGQANATTDGLHLSASGASRMAALVAQVLSPVLKLLPTPVIFSDVDPADLTMSTTDHVRSLDPLKVCHPERSATKDSWS